VADRNETAAALFFLVAFTHSFDSFDAFNFFDLQIPNSQRSSPKNSATYGAASLVCALPFRRVRAGEAMLNVPILETRNHRRLVVEGNRLALGTLMLLIFSVPALGQEPSRQLELPCAPSATVLSSSQQSNPDNRLRSSLERRP
jgi:hypothetical protein